MVLCGQVRRAKSQANESATLAACCATLCRVDICIGGVTVSFVCGCQLKKERELLGEAEENRGEEGRRRKVGK
jgi:hypothetical protein